MKGFLKANAILGIAEIAGRIPLIFTAGFLARGIGPEVFGNWALALTIQALVSTIAGLGLSSSLSRLAAGASAERALGMATSAVGQSLAVLELVAVAMLALSKPLSAAAGLTFEPLSLIGLALMLAAVSVVETLLDSFFKSRAAIGRQLAFLLCRSLAEVIAVLVAFGFQKGLPPPDALTALRTYVLLIVAIKAIAYAAIYLIHQPSQEAIPTDLRHEMLRYGLPMVPVALVTWLIFQGNRAILAHTIDHAALGIYSFATMLSAYVHYVGYAIYPVLLPYASRSYDAGRVEEVKAIFASCQLTAVGLLAPVLLVASLFAPEIIAMTAGTSFSSAAGFLPLLAFTAGLEVILGVHQYVLHLVKRPHIIFYLSILNAALTLLAVYVGGLYGIELLPVSLLAATVLFNAVRLAVVRRYLRLPIAGSVTLLTVLLSLTILASMLQSHHFSLRSAVLIVLGGPIMSWALMRARMKDSDAASSENSVPASARVASSSVREEKL